MFDLLLLKIYVTNFYLLWIFKQQKNVFQLSSSEVPMTCHYRFWAAICVIFIANYALPKWAREKVVVSVDCCISFLGFLYFLVSDVQVELSQGLCCF